MIVNQWVPAAHRGDAIGDSARRVRDALRHRGHHADLYALDIDDDLHDDVRPFAHPEATRGQVTILHFAVPSPMTAALCGLAGTRVVQYHNVTPARFFLPYDAGLARLAVLARRELQTLAHRVDLALGDSQYNCDELRALGFTKTAIFPIAVDVGRLTSAPRQPTLEDLLDNGLVKFLFVGRIAPNKRIDQFIRLAEQYKRYVDLDYQFIFVGRHDVVPRYYAAVRALIHQFRMPADRFLFTGPVPDYELATYYRHATVYLSLSDHEGFCVPLIEAMACDVPVLAYDAGAVGETLGGAGVSFRPKDLERAAELLGVMAYSDDVREGVLAGQKRRLADFDPAALDRRVEALLSQFE